VSEPAPAASSATSRQSSPYSLEGRRAVVTGSSSGIGRAIALELAGAGAAVVVHARRSRDAAESVRDEIRRRGVPGELVLADLGVAEGRARLLESAYRSLGTVDIWINNAGADVLTGDGAALSFADKLERLLAVDVRATIFLAREVGARMRAASGGVILNMGWDQAEVGMEGDSGELFGATKSAVMGFTRSVALGLAPSVRVNCLAPGWIRTAWGASAPEEWEKRVLREVPGGRWGTPEDVARVARYLCSDAASFVTGQVVRINGGAVR